MTFQKGDYPLLESYYRAVSNPLPELKKTFNWEYNVLTSYVLDGNKILDVGCGIGRPMIDLAKTHKDKMFVGVDNDECNLAVANIRIKDNNIKNVALENCDALNLTKKYHKFDLIYSTYNTMGSFNDADWAKFISEQSQSLSKGGYLINFTWSRSEETTEFLKQYYSHIGLDLKYIDKDRMIFDNAMFYRISPGVISYLYKQFGIEPEKTETLGQWTAVIGRKL